MDEEVVDVEEAVTTFVVVVVLVVVETAVTKKVLYADALCESEENTFPMITMFPLSMASTGRVN